MRMWKDKWSHNGCKYGWQSFVHSHEDEKYNLCNIIIQEYLWKKCECANHLTDVFLTSEYAVDFSLPFYGNIRLKPSAFQKKWFEKYSPRSVEKFFASLDCILQIDILPCTNLPLLRIYAGKEWYRYLPLELFLDALPDSISKKFLGAENLIDKAKIAIKALNKQYNFSRK